MKKPTRYKDEKMASLICRFAAEYFLTEANQSSLLTITGAEVFDRGKRAVVFFTTLPREKESDALELMGRKSRDFRHFVMDKKSFGFVPKIKFAIDEGEHNRQRIDELSNEDQK